MLVYITGDRPPILAVIAEDAVLPLYEQLLALAEAELRKRKVDLFLYSHGGDVSVPWRIVTMMREFCSAKNGNKQSPPAGGAPYNPIAEASSFTGRLNKNYIDDTQSCGGNYA